MEAFSPLSASFKTNKYNYYERVDYLQMELEQWHRLRQLDDQAGGLQGFIRILVLVSGQSRPHLFFIHDL